MNKHLGCSLPLSKKVSYTKSCMPETLRLLLLRQLMVTSFVAFLPSRSLAQKGTVHVTVENKLARKVFV